MLADDEASDSWRDKIRVASKVWVAPDSIEGFEEDRLVRRGLLPSPKLDSA